MADTTVPSNLQEIAWDNKFFTDYIQADILKTLMGTNENSVIQVKEQLSKQDGDTITIQLVNRLTNDATTGTTYHGCDSADPDIAPCSDEELLAGWKKILQIA